MAHSISYPNPFADEDLVRATDAFSAAEVTHSDGTFSGSKDASDSKVFRRREGFVAVEADHGDAGAYFNTMSTMYLLNPMGRAANDEGLAAKAVVMNSHSVFIGPWQVLDQPVDQGPGMKRAA